MKIYNILYRSTRIVHITPSKDWEDEGGYTATSLLGVDIRIEEY